jgi:hypothetical protein
VYPVRENPSWDGIPTTDHLLKEAIMVSLTQRPSSNWLVVGISTPLKNDGLRQWEGLYIPYMKWKIKVMFETTNQLTFL